MAQLPDKDFIVDRAVARSEQYYQSILAYPDMDRADAMRMYWANEYDFYYDLITRTQGDLNPTSTEGVSTLNAGGFPLAGFGLKVITFDPLADPPPPVEP